MKFTKGELGIDVSKWQGKIDFNSLKTYKDLKFALLRSSFRATIDPMFLEYAAGFKSINIPIMGVYHFSYALKVADAVSEAQFCIASLQKASINPGDCIIFYDFEYDTVDQAKKAGVTLTPTLCNQFTKAFCDEVEKFGYVPGVYFNGDYYLNWYDKGLLSNYIRWIADWRASPLTYDCQIHQYYNKGKLPGINADVDMNIVLQDFEIGATDQPKPPVLVEPETPSKPQVDLSLSKGWMLREINQNGRNSLLSQWFDGLEEIIVAKQVLVGMWGNGDERRQKLESAGYSYSAIQIKVNELLK